MLRSRHVPWILLTVGGGLVLALWAIGPLRTTAGRPAPAPRPDSSADANHARARHYVSPQQLADSNAMVQRKFGDLRVAAPDGRPVVLLFVKEGCPCNGEVEPLFQRVEKLYRAEVHFARVIDAGADAAARYAAEHGVAEPVLPDPERQLIRRFQVKNGCYVVLLTPDGVIDGFWPGCSAETMRDLGQRTARLAGVEGRPLDVSGMPVSLTTGCPYKD